jgi:methylenetetrahydrofolate dehydrogenase (NADP+)/methenyltetrahydrofolate cyclohydrolase
MLVLDGKIASAAVKASLLEQTNALKAAGKRTPHLAAILVGNNGASETYVASKVKNCEETGFGSSLFRFEDTVTEAELLAQIEALNQNQNVDGILVQLPLPKHIDDAKVIEAIDPKKDVDGFHPVNLGNMVLNLPGFLPATPAGIVELLKRNNIVTEGKKCVIIGRSNIVGTPLSIMLGRNSNPGNCTVTLAHSRTQNLKEICQTADILIAAIGQPDFVTADMVKEGAVIIDVGTTTLTVTMRSPCCFVVSTPRPFTR